MTFSEQMKAKADEVRLESKAKDLGDAVAELVKTAVGIVAGYAQENREKVDGMLDKAEHAIDAKTGGKHAETMTKVRAQVDKGIDKLVEQKAPADHVPDDVHSAFPDEPQAGSPS